MFLSAEELRELTGYRRHADQRKWLERNGISYLVSARGRPSVMCAEVERVMRGEAQPTGTDPDWRHLP